MGCASSITYLFLTLGPFVGISMIGLTPDEYGFLNLIPPVGLIRCSLASNWLGSRRERLDCIQIGGAISLLAIAVIFFFFIFGKINIWTLFFPIPFLFFGTTLIFNNASTFALDNMQDKSNGSAIMSFINLILPTTAVLLVGSINSLNPILMPTFFFFFVLLLLFLQKSLKVLS